ncbi:hypothetical protein AAKU55_000639 [Oxalobacteraceae bacterium GrIS 1.11]
MAKVIPHAGEMASSLSTKLSTASVDKKEKYFVYRDLAARPVFQLGKDNFSAIFPDGRCSCIDASLAPVAASRKWRPGPKTVLFFSLNISVMHREQEK